MTARILTSLGKLWAQNDSRMEKSFQQLLLTQWADGGWRCNTVKLGKSANTDASNPGTTLYLLDAFRYRNNSIEDNGKLNRGVTFLLQHWETRKPLGPCDFGMGSRFFQLEFPFLRYNLFYYVFVLSFYEQARHDKRFLAAYQILESKVKDNQVIPENPHKYWRSFEFAKKNHVSLQASKRWMEINNNLKRP